MTSLHLWLLLVVLAALLPSIPLVWMIRLLRQTYFQSTAELRTTLLQSQATIADLTNKLVSRDAMTYAALTQVQTSSQTSVSEHLTPVGTDTDEWRRHQQYVLGNTVTDEDYADDIALHFS